MPQEIVEGLETHSDLAPSHPSKFKARNEIDVPFARASLDILDRSKALCMRSSTARDKSDSSP